ncbi:putative deoxyribonuclease [Buchnera aphidicola (Nipponaphis monzeni)]|uniref:Putative deoxyribonuclease n=1 Tax=Buchnera aphidicola (Nipponaphis monzeni) TaxID=2495405 RepID=A0A455TAD6_9GAMM|nr:YchF/TatD family DNA exonuclease [Buchnera aphidicola]BBI01283.1 putative deoxyribonuclease [Buchnera aphidicola (Nipponaphis monzeni)]
MFLVDSHCHIDQLNYNTIHQSINDVFKKSISNYVKLILNVSTSVENFCNMYKLIGNRENVKYSCGIHPLENNNCYNYNQLYALCSKKIVIAIGETGLDYFNNIVSKKSQICLFKKQIQISILLNKPIIIHTRNSIKDVINILKDSDSSKCVGLIHSFTENLNALKKLLDLGFYISLSGIITFKNSNNLRSIIKYIPLDRLLLETDSPYLSPIPYRGTENQPAYLYVLANYISKLLNIDISKIAVITTNNFKKLFNLNFKTY